MMGAFQQHRGSDASLYPGEAQHAGLKASQARGGSAGGGMVADDDPLVVIRRDDGQFLCMNRGQIGWTADRRRPVCYR